MCTPAKLSSLFLLIHTDSKKKSIRFYPDLYKAFRRLQHRQKNSNLMLMHSFYSIYILTKELNQMQVHCLVQNSCMENFVCNGYPELYKEEWALFLIIMKVLLILINNNQDKFLFQNKVSVLLKL